jgi:hypothetical protein
MYKVEADEAEDEEAEAHTGLNKTRPPASNFDNNKKES